MPYNLHTTKNPHDGKKKKNKCRRRFNLFGWVGFRDRCVATSRAGWSGCNVAQFFLLYDLKENLFVKSFASFDLMWNGIASVDDGRSETSASYFIAGRFSRAPFLLVSSTFCLFLVLFIFSWIILTDDVTHTHTSPYMITNDHPAL
jgi:hypothetical protein